MKNNMNRIAVCLLPFFSCLSFNACADENTGDGDWPSGKDVVYQAVPVPPSIAPVDESGYTVYYVDSGELGNDQNDGLSETTPFATLEKITNMAKAPKMKVLLKSGSVFTGTLTLADNHGTAAAPFIVDSYGSGPRPLINGAGASAAVEIRDGNTRFRNIAVTNKNGYRGIHITPTVAGAMKNIEITGCRVEEVNWSGSDEIVGVNPSTLDVQNICSNDRYSYSYGGIIFNADTRPETGPSWFEDIFITNNEVHKVARTGIWMDSQWAKRPGLGWGHNDYVDDENGWFPASNIVVQGNLITYPGGDGVVLIATKDSFLDHNTVYHANYLGRTGYYNVALWPHSSINCVMQFNEVAYTHLENGGGDGEGLDVDIANIDCLVQFNYVHHNDGGGILICNNSTEINGQQHIGDHRGTVVRNNVFYDNGKGGENPAFCVINSAVGKTELYNNTVIMTGRRSDAMVFLSADWADLGKSRDITVRNNIFMATTPMSGIFNTNYVLNCRIENNLAFQIGRNNGLAADKILTFDPLMAIPDDLDGFENALKFIPGAKEAFEKGMFIDGMPLTDMAGNGAENIPYLGAFSRP